MQMPYGLCGFDIEDIALAPDVVVPVKAWLLLQQLFVKF